jgi:hypothetical protein
MIKLARQRHPDITFYHADICKWDFPRTYDFISAWDSIWHLPLSEQELVLQKFCKVCGQEVYASLLPVVWMLHRRRSIQPWGLKCIIACLVSLACSTCYLTPDVSVGIWNTTSIRNCIFMLLHRRPSYGVQLTAYSVGYAPASGSS